MIYNLSITSITSRKYKGFPKYYAHALKIDYMNVLKFNIPIFLYYDYLPHT